MRGCGLFFDTPLESEDHSVKCSNALLGRGRTRRSMRLLGILTLFTRDWMKCSRGLTSITTTGQWTIVAAPFLACILLSIRRARRSAPPERQPRPQESDHYGQSLI